MFKNEVDILARIRHPDIVTFVGACQDPGHPYIVSEYISGGSLYEILHIKGQELSIATTLIFANQIAAGMNYLHHCRPPIIHRDLKSKNIMVNEQLTHAKITDFGLSKFKVISELNKSIVGSPLWMAPEMMTDESIKHGYDEKVDVYSYGMVLYEMCSGKLQFPDVSTQVTLYKKVVENKERPDINDCKRVPRKLRVLIQKCWDSDPNERPSFQQIVWELEQITS